MSTSGVDLTRRPRPALSVVVATCGRPELLDAALVSLRAALADSDELVVVESGSAEPEPVWQVARRHGATLLVADERGVSRARNLGWRKAAHDLVAFVDDDVRVRPGWADAMARALASHPGAAFVAGRIDLPEGQGTLSLTVKDDPSPQEYDASSGGALGHSANLGMHRAVLAQVGGFDEAMGPGTRWPAGEDPDLLDRVLATGAHGWYEPAAAAYHEHWRRARQYIALQHSYGRGAGARLAKLARTDRRRFRVVAADDLWRWGLASIGRELGKRDWLRAAGSVLRLGGMVRGMVTALVVPVEGGHFRPAAHRRRGSSS
ncbi:MAG TPA: glycosyltransferase [Mycobacteriales bacterium]|nr:glycosyltransferase [Mycobacteriales bacterium]